MTRFARRVDDNQAQLVAVFRRLGCSVFSLASVGRGCPDLLVGCMGRNWLVEVKDGAKVKSARKLTPLEAEFHATWSGAPVAVVETVEDALALVAKWRAGVASDVAVDPSDWERPPRREVVTDFGPPSEFTGPTSAAAKGYARRAKR